MCVKMNEREAGWVLIDSAKTLLLALIGCF